MTTRAEKVETAIRAVVAAGFYPSAMHIQRALGEHVTYNLNGRDLRVRDHVLPKLGYVRQTDGPRSWKRSP